MSVPMQHPFSLQSRKILILTHKGADVDALSASGVLYLLLREKNLVEIAIPEHLNKAAEKLAETMEIPYTCKPDFSSFDTLFIADLNSYSMLGPFAESVRNFKGEIFLFDHHSLSKDPVKAAFSLVGEEAASTTELLWLELKKQGIKPGDKIATLTACGLLTDSAHFHFASPNSFRVMAEAMELVKESYHGLQGLFSTERDFSERIARLKAARKCRIFKVGKHIAVSSEIGAFESHSASALVQIGSDVSFVAMEEKGTVRVSGRARYDFAEEFDIDLAKDVMQKLGEHFEGEGGGHSTAASFTGKGKPEQILDRCMQLLLEKMKEKKKRGLDFKEYK